MRHVKRAVRADLARFKAFIEIQEVETGAWRGVIHDGEMVEKHKDSYDKKRDYAEFDDVFDTEHSHTPQTGNGSGSSRAGSTRSSRSKRSSSSGRGRSSGSKRGSSSGRARASGGSASSRSKASSRGKASSKSSGSRSRSGSSSSRSSGSRKRSGSRS